ncbi:MAG: thiamine phosphate synthase [Candidatus Omnitrophica bacterium]|nr:thiamine phosphate synthase [Candidatus Omnitrophota bacterium]
MISKKKRLSGSRLYLILDIGVCDYRRSWEILKAAVRGGVDIVQLRDKHGVPRETLKFAQRIQAYLKDRIPFIVNDRVDIAFLSGASGVHVGQDDLSVMEARKILGSKKIIGTSCQTLAHIRRAEEDGADYIGFGSVFKTFTKPDRSPMDEALLRKAAQATRIPRFAIGGITGKNVARVKTCGHMRVAVCRDIMLSDDVALSVGELKKLLFV